MGVLKMPIGLYNFLYLKRTIYQISVHQAKLVNALELFQEEKKKKNIQPEGGHRKA